MRGIITVVITISVLSSGCSNSNTISEDQVPTSATIIVGQNEYEMLTGKYTWNGEKIKARSVDEYSAIEVAGDFDTLTVEQNTDIEIVVEEDPSLTTFEWKENKEKNEIPLEDNKITSPSHSGVYVYEVHAEWSNGEAFFVFDIEVK